MPATAAQLLGARAEQLALEYLQARGLTILERNYRRRLGEIDLVARDGDVLVIAEVRTRSSGAFGGAAASVDGRKQRRIIRASAQLLQRQPAYAALPVRFDVLIVTGVAAGTPRVQWLRHAFEA
ncbi:MAG TPA: YraN family protein [Steroidobacteraceae bacterium]|nr:YraN family protein [Steroidobacteraceae bacterium]